MSRSRRASSTNCVGLLIAFASCLILGSYGMISVTSRDPLWFLQGFEDRPSRIIVYQGGQRTELPRGQAGFDELAEAVEASLAQGFARLTSIGFSDKTLQTAYTQHLTLEVFWDRPVELHAWFPTGRTTQMLVPITGPHSELSIVLLGDGGRYRAGAPALNSLEPVHEALRSLGYDY
jgi:hypothetical protein